MTPPSALFHALLRPAILQILRATGYHAAKNSVLDTLTDIAARYLMRLSELSVIYAAHNGAECAIPDVPDVREALEYMGAFMPQRPELEQVHTGQEDMRGLEQFLAWVEGPFNKELRRIALDGDDEATDYFDALKKKHGKTDDDSKFQGTILGKPNEHGEVLIEGGPWTSIREWEDMMHKANERPREPVEPEADTESRPQSSGLSSLGDRTLEDDMDLDLM